jgi:CDP-diacylglycerol--inositol 3-phosphatidyltransferase
MRQRVPVALYVPNLLGYARILSAFLGLYLSSTHPVLTIWVWSGSASLDLFDGILARRFNQCSQLGIYIDIVADIVLRTCCWLAAVVASKSRSLLFCVCVIISMEWFTMVATQLHATHNQQHWKTQRDNDPWLVREVFSSNFKSPLGILTIYGLFFANMLTYACQQPVLRESIPFFMFWMYVAYAGRAVAMCVEIWLCYNFLVMVIEQDTAKRDNAVLLDEKKKRIE